MQLLSCAEFWEVYPWILDGSWVEVDKQSTNSYAAHIFKRVFLIKVGKAFVSPFLPIIILGGPAGARGLTTVHRASKLRSSVSRLLSSPRTSQPWCKITIIRRHLTWRSLRPYDPLDIFKYSSFNTYSTEGGEFYSCWRFFVVFLVWSMTMKNRHGLQHFANWVIINTILQSVEWINILFDLPDIGSEGGMSGADIYARAMMIQIDNLIRFFSQA